MRRKIIRIDDEKCNGCGACAAACHEGAIGMEKGKARLMREDYCDGLGDCLPACPTGAISFEEREAPAYDAAAVMAAKEKTPGFSGCPGAQARTMAQTDCCAVSPSGKPSVSRLTQWPCQLRLVPAGAPYFDGARLLIAADCTAYAYANLHQDFICGRITLVGCPKLDPVDYSEKLTEILRRNDIRDITLLRMEVPCCGGLGTAAKKALLNSGKSIPLQVITLSVEGNIVE